MFDQFVSGRRGFGVKRDRLFETCPSFFRLPHERVQVSEVELRLLVLRLGFSHSEIDGFSLVPFLRELVKLRQLDVHGVVLGVNFKRMLVIRFRLVVLSRQQMKVSHCPVRID